MPQAAGALIVLAPALDVADLEAVELEIGSRASKVVELAAGENVAGQRLEFRPLLPERAAWLPPGRVIAWCR